MCHERGKKQGDAGNRWGLNSISLYCINRHTHTHTHTHTRTHTHTHTHMHAHTHTRTHTHVGFYGLRGLSIGVMVFILYKLYVLLPYTYPTPKLSPHRRRCISIFPQKTLSVWFISILNYGDTENVLINHLLLVIPMSYPWHYTNLCPHKPHKHAHTHTHARTHTHTRTDRHTHTHTHTHARMHAHTHTPAHTHTRTHARTHARMHADTYTQDLPKRTSSWLKHISIWSWV